MHHGVGFEDELADDEDEGAWGYDYVFEFAPQGNASFEQFHGWDDEDVGYSTVCAGWGEAALQDVCGWDS